MLQRMLIECKTLLGMTEETEHHGGVQAVFQNPGLDEAHGEAKFSGEG